MLRIVEINLGNLEKTISEAGKIMNIQSDQYQIAPLNGDDQTLKAIKEAEQRLYDLTGKEVTLIAYEKKEE
ncbi:hypothetical protein D3C76_766370 [compost metagenome]